MYGKNDIVVTNIGKMRIGNSACIGGMVGTGCSGTNAVRWGTMREWVINLTVVMPDGQVVKTRQRPR